MNIATHPAEDVQAPREFAFNDEDFTKIAALANKTYGLFLQESKKPLVYSRLARRLRALSLKSFADYCALLQSDAGNEEQAHFLTALTTNVTHFFREQHHFTQLQTEILPKLAGKLQDGGGLRIWSAACSAGQEAYCLAATVLDVFPDAAKRNVKILATDVDPIVLEKGRVGSYPAEQLPALGAAYRDKMIDPALSDDEQFTMRQGLRDLISFGQLNLMDDWPMRGRFDIIMCRNAAIYFDKQTQARLWSRFATALQPRGYLMIGHSERLSGEADALFTNIGVTAYQKK